MRQEGEASVEEILESIKKVIARDNRASAVIDRRKREEEGMSEEALEAANEPDEEDILDLGTAELIEQDEADRPDDEASLITERTRETMRDNLAALAMLSEPGVPPQIVRTGETSLEGMVREMLRPMLAEWLDKNLPGMVEKMVKAEISRIAGKRG
ncbi:DUF2497 domain-containing protein [Pontixanthobacter aestiaquae]|uniref:DUF2497 domain-containing protein n=1 Tax=Pontixanthobacter aestiaquae TaxID=1509367 RepID=A0A844Z4E2_9SPHN|nr:DUF2497 domain-containing protein [Pontixanthobacter aestiaquae]MDN3646872.1 DUF2497 domain-containing protein [Pontixanthobacter aestiaquae]MXO82146.1 DUF2497 domain-containing protein [Pontixanthobacter aestiaquae]